MASSTDSQAKVIELLTNSNELIEKVQRTSSQLAADKASHIEIRQKDQRRADKDFEKILEEALLLAGLCEDDALAVAENVAAKASNQFEKQAKRAKLVENKTDVESDETKAWHQLHELAGQSVNREFPDQSDASEKAIEGQAKAEPSMEVEHDFVITKVIEFGI